MLYIKCENFNGLTLDNNKDNIHSINFLFTNGIYFLPKYSVLAVKAWARDLFFYLTPNLEGVSHNQFEIVYCKPWHNHTAIEPMILTAKK